MTAVKHEEYEKPQITYYGDLTQLTEGQSVGNHFDGNFSTGQLVPPNFLSCRAPTNTCGSFVVP